MSDDASESKEGILIYPETINSSFKFMRKQCSGKRNLLGAHIKINNILKKLNKNSVIHGCLKGKERGYKMIVMTELGAHMLNEKLMHHHLHSSS